MATRHPMDVDTCEMESQTDTGNLKPSPLKKKKLSKHHILKISMSEVPISMFLGAFLIPSRSLHLVTTLNKNMVIFNQVSKKKNLLNLLSVYAG